MTLQMDGSNWSSNTIRIQPIVINTMWSIASHAGTGLAVAGLSATYYALARKTYQLERESIQSSDSAGHDSGDAPTVPIQISPSQRLLKKEMHLIGRNSGHVIGLNVVTSTSNLQSKYNFSSNLRNIRSRFECIDSRSAGECTEEKDLSQPRLPTISSSNDSSESMSVFAVEEFSSLEFSGDSQPLPTSGSPTAFTEKSNSHAETHDRDAGDVLESENISNDSVEKVFPVHRTESPIIFYKNPEFTNEEQQSTVTLLAKENCQTVKADGADETIFNEISTIDDIRDYNLKLIALREYWCPHSNPEEEIQVEHVNTSSKSLPELLKHKESQEDNAEDEVNEDLDECSLPSDLPEEIPEENAVTEELGPTAEMQTLDESYEIENNPMKSFMERMATFCCNYFQPVPFAVTSVFTQRNEDSYKFTVMFVSCVVIVAGFIGRFFMSLVDWLHSTLETEDNPEAVLDH